MPEKRSSTPENRSHWSYIDDDDNEVEIEDIVIPPARGSSKLIERTTLELDEEDILDVELQPHSKAHRDLSQHNDPFKTKVDVPHDPDGVKHSVVGITALVAVMIAMLIAVMLVTGSLAAKIGAVALALIAIPVLVSSMAEKDTTGKG